MKSKEWGMELMPESHTPVSDVVEWGESAQIQCTVPPAVMVVMLFPLARSV